MAQPVPNHERARRQKLMETLVNQGYTVLGEKGEKPSAAQEGKRRDGVNYARWIRDEEKIRAKGERHYLPNWIGAFDGEIVMTKAEAKPAKLVESTPEEHAATRAKALSAEISALVTRSNYPVINPDAVIVDSYLSRRYNRKDGEHRLVEGTPRTWLTDTLRVAPVPDSRGRKFIFTGAQNDAPLHEEFWANLKAYAAHIDAEVVVGPWTYETQWWAENNPTARAYADELSEHLCFGQMAIGDNFVFCGEMNTIPTASQPISDLTTYPRNRWAVFPHAKRQLKSVPSTDPSVQAHQVMTTGAVTKPKVIPRKAGVKSLFHAVLGAVVVEFDFEGLPFCRQITADSAGSFYDLTHRVEDGRVTSGHRIEALVCGDIHLRKMDRANAAATFGFSDAESQIVYRSSIIGELDPRSVVLHDVFDNETRNHHSAGDPAHGMTMYEQARDRVIDEVYEVSRFLEKLGKESRRVIVVESNHDIGLERYIREGRYRFDAPNVKYGLKLETAYMNYRSNLGAAIQMGQEAPKFSLLEYAVRDLCPDLEGTTWAYDGHSYLIGGIECGHHGFRGTNGSKGTVQGFARTGRKLTIGDKHSPEINEGVYVAGTMTLQQGYNKGPSSWAVSHVVQYADGSRAIITLQKGRWRAEKPRIAIKSGR